MLKIKQILFAPLLILIINSCHKTAPITYPQPTASFTTDKNEYIAGNTVNLTNTSTDGSFYLWTMSDGSTLASKDAKYPIDAGMGFGKLTFKLVTYSQDIKKIDTVSKTVAVIPASSFTIIPGLYTTMFKPRNASSSQSGNNWLISGSVTYPSPSDHFYAAYIYLPGTTAPTIAKTYILQSNYNKTLLGDTASVFLWDYTPDADNKYHSLSGQLEITIVNGKVHAVFNNVSIYASYVMSGDITCP